MDGSHLSTPELLHRVRLARAQLGNLPQASRPAMLNFCTLASEIKVNLERRLSIWRESGSDQMVRQGETCLGEITALHLEVQEHVVNQHSPPTERTNVELMNTRIGSPHHLNFYCRCGTLLCLAQDVNRIYRNCVWAQHVSNTRVGDVEHWNPYKQERSFALYCANCGLRVGDFYPDMRLYKLFYVDMNGYPSLLCGPASGFSSIKEAVAKHEALDPNGRSVFPRQGAPVKRELEKKRAKDLGLSSADDQAMRVLTQQLKDATLRSAICATQRAEKASLRLQERNRQLEEQVRLSVFAALLTFLDRTTPLCRLL